MDKEVTKKESMNTGTSNPIVKYTTNTLLIGSSSTLGGIAGFMGGAGLGTALGSLFGPAGAGLGFLVGEGLGLVGGIYGGAYGGIKLKKKLEELVW